MDYTPLDTNILRMPKSLRNQQSGGFFSKYIKPVGQGILNMGKQLGGAIGQGVSEGFGVVGKTINQTPGLKQGVGVLNALDYGLGTAAKTTEGLLTKPRETLMNLKYRPGEGLQGYAQRNVTDITPYVTQKVAGTPIGQKIPLLAPMLGLGAGMISPSPSDLMKVGKVAGQAGDLAKFSDDAGDLVSQAKKYKSADEFVKAQGTPVYHGTNYANARMIQKEGINPENAGAIQDWMKGNKYSFFTGDEKYAQSYGIQKGGGDTKSGRSFVLAIKSPKDIQIETSTFKKGMKFPDLVSQQKINPENIYIKGIDNKWYPIKEFNFFTGESDTFIGKTKLDELPIKTKSQLIDIWNKAQEKPTDLIQEAKKYSNKNEFLMSQGALTTDTTYATKKRLLAKADKTTDMGEWIDEFSDELKSLGLKNYDELKQDVESTKRLIEKEMKLSKIWDDANQTRETKTTTESQPTDLTQEAKKYKTAEEFVNGQPTYYHGGDLESGVKQGLYLTSDKVSATKYSGTNKGRVYEYNVPKNIKLVKPSEYDTVFGSFGYNNEKTAKYFSDNGFDGMKTGDGDLIIFKPELLKTKSQLTDIWNKANQSTDLISEAKKYKTAEEFVKGQPKLYHGGKANIKEVDLSKSRYNKTFYLTDNPEYAKSTNAKTTLNEMVLDTKANLADMTKPNQELISQIETLAKGTETGKTITIKKPDGTSITIPETPKDSISFYPYSKEQVIQGIKDGKAYFAELEGVKNILKKLGYDGQITSEVPYAKNIGVWNKDVIKTKSQLTDIWNKAQGN